MRKFQKNKSCASFQFYSQCVFLIRGDLVFILTALDGYTLTPRALQGPNFGRCCFGQVFVVRKCDMIFWEFYGR
jgi:hypothetical protein